MPALLPLLYQGLVSMGLVLLIYTAFRLIRPDLYGYTVVSVLLVLALLSVVNAFMGVAIRPWGLWLLYTSLSAVGGFLIIALTALLYDALRPPGVPESGPAALGFMIVAFPYLLLNLIALIVRFFTPR